MHLFFSPIQFPLIINFELLLKNKLAYKRTMMIIHGDTSFASFAVLRSYYLIHLTNRTISFFHKRASLIINKILN